jgi:hypothetical protein
LYHGFRPFSPRFILSLSPISNHDLWKETVPIFFDRASVNLLCVDAEYVDAGKGLCVDVYVSSISTVV